ncbi:phage tail protein [Nitrococcus mobilis]|uniref:Phage tail protein n=1 Tax=Nitrococcus mobilis Nb-231 TaxID=314278 RepID=A4BR05_9GAMM|nr:phage tail protein [Nitrococcus mobilis]EAR22005.1 Phage tail protein [Nitrococcus mobilis Nb-231]
MLRSYALVHGEDQWRRAAFEDASLAPEDWAVQLAWEVVEPEAPDAPNATPPPAAGLAFDPWCRLYHSLPEAGQVERTLWAAYDLLDPQSQRPAPVALFEAAPLPAGEFSAIAQPVGALDEPRGLAVDADGRLFVAERGAGRILIYDLWERRLLRKLVLAGARPLDLASDGRRIYAVVEGSPDLLVLEARSEPRRLPIGLENLSRIAAGPAGGLWLLLDAGAQDARIVRLDAPDDVLAVPFATDIEFQEAETLVAARLPGEDFRRFSIQPGATDELPPIRARDYDGRGIVRTPDGRIGFWTRRGFRHAVPARVRYVSEGRVTTFRLDSGEFQTVWGRLFIDACIPANTQVRVHCIVADEPPEGAVLLRSPPANTETVEIRRPDLSPPMPPVALLPADNARGLRLHRRETGRELPWVRQREGDLYETYELPVIAEAGRYLWVMLDLSGNTRSTPRVRSLRAEYPSHDLLRRLPRLYSRDPPAAEFLRRYLAIFEGAWQDLESRAFARRALLDPHSAPPELLPWLAGFVGLVLDERWPVERSRVLIEEAIWLFRFRGTVPGLKRFLALYLGRDVILIEHFRVRGLGGAVVGGDSPLAANAILGAGFRVGGALGEPGQVAVLDQGRPADGFAVHAHRFSVVIPLTLTSEQREVVEHILILHRPAHTRYDICTVDAGMRVGVGLYTGLTSLVGRSAGFDQLRLGSSSLGRHAVVGRPAPGTRVGSGRLGGDTRVG